MLALRRDPQTALVSLLDDLFDRPIANAFRESAFREPRLMPLNVSDNGDSYEAEAQLPGFSREEISVEIDGATLTLSAESRRESESASEPKAKSRSMLREISVTKAVRSVTFPSEIDADKAVAKLENGHLLLTLPKKASSRGKALPIS